MIGELFFVNISKEEKKNILIEVQNDLKEKCFINGKWYADYRRIRILARKVK